MSNENTCISCDRKFIPSTSHPFQKCCSKKCRANAHHRKKRGLPIKLTFLNCKVCDKSFEQKRANNINYCCQYCKGLAGSRKLQGLPIKGPRKIIRHSGHINQHGYKLLAKKHPNSSKQGKILEHVYVMSEYLNRPLFKHERVHHINGIRDDNRIANLELWSHSHPYGQRIEDKISWCKEFLELYGYTVIKNQSNQTS